jgi:hypothetical protein
MPQKPRWSDEELFLVRVLRPCCKGSEILEIFRILGYANRTDTSLRKIASKLGIRYNSLAYPDSKRINNNQKKVIDDVLKKRLPQTPPINPNSCYRQMPMKAEKMKAAQLIKELSEMRYELDLKPTLHIPMPHVRTGMSLGALLSDVHLGRKYNDEVGRMTYSVAIARKRLLKYAHEIVGAIKYNRSVSELVLCIIGDIADGLDIFPNHSEYLETAPFYQTKAALEVIWEMLLIIKNAFPDLPIRIVTVRGNHGGIRSTSVSNWDSIVYQMLEIAIDVAHNDMPSGIRIFNNFERTYNTVDIQGHKYLLRHKAPVQADTNAQMGKFAGWYGIHHWDAFCYAHFHHYGIMSWNSKPILRNGAVIGADYYAEELSVYDDPNQLIFGVTEDRVACFWESVNLLDT